LTVPFKELREAQTAFVGGSHPGGVYFALVAIYAFVSLFRAVGTEGLMVPLMELESALWALDEAAIRPARRRPSIFHPRPHGRCRVRQRP
jgi:hypothetical protein